MRNEVVMDQLIPLHKPNKKSEEGKDDGLTYSSNQTPYKGARVGREQRAQEIKASSIDLVKPWGSIQQADQAIEEQVQNGVWGGGVTHRRR
jgi:hypothetical protein